MKASDRRAAAASGLGGGSTGMWDHHNPELEMRELWPARLNENIVLEKIPLVTSADMVLDLEKRGAKVVHNYFAPPNYRQGTYVGKNRQLDNTDWINGKEPLYDSLDHVNQVRLDLKDVIGKWTQRCKEGGIIGQMEMEDLEKVTAQQWKSCGWFLEAPVTKADVPDKLPFEAIAAIKAVVGRYAKINKRLGLLNTDPWKLVLEDDDPGDTLSGAPTFVGGTTITHAARMAALKVFPSPQGMTPERWADMVRNLDSMLQMPESYSYSPIVSTRQGPFKKPGRLWFRSPGGFASNWQATNAYSRTRLVYPASYPVNFLLSPLYVLCSTARKNIPGFWQDPTSRSNYIKLLQAQGKKAYSIDFSGMDTGMWPPIIQAILHAMVSEGMATWNVRAFSELYKTMGITYPSYEGVPDCSTSLQGNVRPWASGFKMTSEMDTIYGAAVLLSALERQFPGITKEWERGDFVFAEQGDDILFTTDRVIDSDKLASDALSMWGATLKIQEDAIFLKWMMPVIPEIKTPARTMARFVQQTFYNEDRYSGVEGGDKPDAILKLGLVARMEGLDHNPWFKEMWPDVRNLVMSLKYVKNDADACHALAAGHAPTLTTKDMADILQYGQRVGSFTSDLLAESEYKYSAQVTLDVLRRNGLNIQEDVNSRRARELYLKALFSQPSSADIATVHAISGR